MRKYYDFIERMMRAGRFMVLHDEGKIALMLFFSVTDEPEKFLNNLDYEFLEHDPDGKTLVIDGLVCGSFKWEYVSRLKEAFYKKYPQIEKTMWIREKEFKDIIVTYRRKNYYAVEY